MVIGLSDRIADTITPVVHLILLGNFPAGDWIMIFHPGAEGWADIEADLLEIPQLGVWPVTFGVDSFIPVWEGGSSNFARDNTSKGVFSRWLVEVGMNAKVMSYHSHLRSIVDSLYFTELFCFVQKTTRVFGISRMALQCSATLRPEIN